MPTLSQQPGKEYPHPESVQGQFDQIDRLAREMLTTRSRLGLTQEEAAGLMGTTKSAVSRLEATGKHTPSLTTL